jgi:uncharacterized NAD(P)/FAD-binding protein YdhS
LEQKRSPVVAIVGAGFAGTMTAVHLLRSGPEPLEVVLIERSGKFGRGVAYATKDPNHLLNVPVELMSAFCEQPLHFVAWMNRQHDLRGSAAFVARGVYGDYIESILQETERQASPNKVLRRVKGDVVRVIPQQEEFALEFTHGPRISCDRLVLAVGPMASQHALYGEGGNQIVADPWAEPGVSDPPDCPTVVVGMGLTAVDQILSLAESGNAPIVAMSRGGRFPFAHLPGLRLPVPSPVLPSEPVGLPVIERLVCEHIEEMARQGHDWRDVIDGLRPVTPVIWSRLLPSGQRAFVTERLRAWERRRHRMAPSVGKRLGELLDQGRLSTVAGSLAGIDRAHAELQVAIDTDAGRRRVACGRVIFCTGSGMDIRRSESPLLEDLLDRRLVVADELGLGLRADSSGALIDGEGSQPTGRLFTLGALRRGELWETTAVGEIRVQARDVALALGRSLTADHSGAHRERTALLSRPIP